MRFQVLLSLWSITSCLFRDNIPEVTKTNISKPNRYSLSKLRLVHAPPKTVHSITPPHVYVTVRGDLQNTAHRCSIVAAAAAMSWRCCVLL